MRYVEFEISEMLMQLASLDVFLIGEGGRSLVSVGDWNWVSHGAGKRDEGDFEGVVVREFS